MSKHSRPCVDCGKIHDTGVQNQKNGEMIKRFDKCYDCYMESAYTYKPLKGPVKLSDGLVGMLDKIKKGMEQ